MSTATVKQSARVVDSMEKVQKSISTVVVSVIEEDVTLNMERNRLLSPLRGQVMRMPDLSPLFVNWPTKTNPQLDRLRLEIRQWLNA